MSSDRKKTPDILGEILTDISTGSPISSKFAEAQELQVKIDKKKREVKPVVPNKTRNARRTTTPRQAASLIRGDISQKNITEYRLVSFQNYHGWRPRFINGIELEKWTENPVIHTFINRLSEEGWELVTSSSGERMYGTADMHQLFFKRTLPGKH
jgi:hypothetical protein